MAKKKPPVTEESLVVPAHGDLPPAPIVDTHLHLLSTFSAFREKFPASAIETVQEFARKYLSNVQAVVDVWCEAPVLSQLEEFANIPDEQWPFRYNFVVGVHPHNAQDYNDSVEAAVEKAAQHPKNVGIGEIGLDYHYDNSPREIQRKVLRRQLQKAVRLEKPLTIHTREADEDIYTILTECVPANHKIHVHCYTDSLDLCQKLLAFFPNLLFGITGVVSYSSNLNTTAVLKHMATLAEQPRIILETDSPFMVPTNLPLTEMALKSNSRIPFSTSAMIPWTAEWVAKILGDDWTVAKVCQLSRDNARKQYGI